MIVFLRFILFFGGLVLSLQLNILGAMAQERDMLFRVYLAADISESFSNQIEEVLVRRLSRGESQGVDFEIHQAKDVKQDRAVLADALRQKSAGVIVVSDKPQRLAQWREVIGQNTKGQNRPVYLIGQLDDESYQGVDSMIGSTVKSYTRRAARAFEAAGSKEVLCLFVDYEGWCGALEAEFKGKVHSRQIGSAIARSSKMALTVATITQNPQIDGAFVSDQSILNEVGKALNIVGGQFVLGSIASADSALNAEKRPDFTLEPKWSLFTELAVGGLSAAALDKQNLSGLLLVKPNIFNK